LAEVVPNVANSLRRVGAPVDFQCRAPSELASCSPNLAISLREPQLAIEHT